MSPNEFVEPVDDDPPLIDRLVLRFSQVTKLIQDRLASPTIEQNPHQFKNNINAFPRQVMPSMLEQLAIS